MVTASGKMNPRQLRLDFAAHLNSAWRTEDNTRIVMMPNESRPTMVKLAGGPGHIWWVEIEDVRMEEEEPEPEPKAKPSATERLA